ncbi:MAG: haloacid dehalogenase type II [Acidobacteria bacterium]|nr:haloacid dehalogenase type II [Acidobacteriota bacterium]
MLPPALPAPRWLSFDCYGTLIDWESGVRRSFREAARIRSDEEQDLIRTWERILRSKMQGPYTPYARILQDSFRESLEHFGYRCAAHAMETFLNSVANWEPFPDVNPALIRLAQRYRLAIVSNVDRDILGRTLRHLQVRFDALITAEDTRQYNPSPEVFRYTLGKLNCTPQEIVYVAFGSEADLEAAASVGVRVVYLDRGAPLGETKVDAIRNLDELTSLWN